MATYTLTIKQLVENKVEIFNFNYPIFKEEYRKTFEDQFIKHFYFDEIGVETVGKFIFMLNAKLNLIMPNYNKMYSAFALEQRILDNYDITEIFEKTTNNITSSNNESDNVSNSSNTGENKNLYTDTPKKKIDIDGVDYVSNITKDLNKNEGNATVKSTSSNNINDEGIEKWQRTMQGNIGVSTDMDAVTNFCNGLKNIDLLVFEELSELFMQIW